MSRVCVINIAGLSGRALAGASGLWVQSLPAPPRAMAPTFPVVAASVQASMTTGAAPGAHGVIAGGIFRRQCRTFSLNERSNTLLSEKRFWYSRRLPRRLKVGLVFWSNPLAGAADYVIGAATYQPASDLIADQPVGLYAAVSGQIGPFDPGMVRGSGASWRASRWIVEAAKMLWRRHKPDLQWVYLPGLNFESIRHGVDSPEAMAALGELDRLARQLAQAVQADGGQAIIVSDGGYVPVRRAATPNVALRRAGLLKTKPGEGGQVLDLEHSRAFALVDHQMAHLFCADAKAADEAAAVVSQDPAVAAVKPREELFCPGHGQFRSGERIILSAPDAWLAYRWWEDDAEAPALAYQTDALDKSGYDPCELFAGAEPGSIDTRLENIRASRGLADVQSQDQCVLAATCELPQTPDLSVTDLPRIVTSAVFEDQLAVR